MWQAGIKSEGEEIDPRDLEKMIMESRQKGRQKKLLKETKQILAEKRAEKYNKIMSSYLWDDGAIQGQICTHDGKKRSMDDKSV